VRLCFIACKVRRNGDLGNSRMTVCLAKQHSDEVLEVELAVHCRDLRGGEACFFRFMDERPLVGSGPAP